MFRLDTALKFCDELKTQLSDAIGHIEQLNKRYNHIDYMENIRVLEKSRAELSPYIDHLHSQLSLSPTSLSPFVLASSSSSSSTPVVHRHRQRHHTTTTTTITTKFDSSTPKVAAKICRALELSPIQKPNTLEKSAVGSNLNISVKRSVQDINQNNNTIAVRALKVQRNIETVLNHLKVLQRIHQRNHVIALEQSLYQSCNSSMCGTSSPGKLGHTHCHGGQYWSLNDSSVDSFNASIKTPKKKQSHPYMTPLRKIQSQLLVSHAVLLRSC